jgi:hypothetical protein
MPPAFIPLGILCLLLANIRGTWIASRWQNVGDAFPDRLQETWRDRLVDVLPARTWPGGKYFFFLISIGLFVLTGLGIFRMSTMRSRGQAPPRGSSSYRLRRQPISGRLSARTGRHQLLSSATGWRACRG